MPILFIFNSIYHLFFYQIIQKSLIRFDRHPTTSPYIFLSIRAKIVVWISYSHNFVKWFLMFGVNVDVLNNAISTRSFTVPELNRSCPVRKDVFVLCDIKYHPSNSTNWTWSWKLGQYTAVLNSITSETINCSCALRLRFIWLNLIRKIVSQWQLMIPFPFLPILGMVSKTG
jgi:hypothetical protein